MTPSLAAWQRLFLALVSGALLAVPFLSPAFFWLTWIAFLPLLMAIERVGLLAAYGLGLASGVMFSMTAGYWVADFLVIAKGYGLVPTLLLASVIWLLSAQVTALIAVFLNGLRRLSRRYAMAHDSVALDFVLFPLVVAAAYGLVPLLFPFHPADTQARFLVGIQAIELTGIYGLDAIIALVNIMVFRALVRQNRGANPTSKIPAAAPWVLASVVLALWFVYGIFAVRAWDDRLASWATLSVGIVQPNEAPSINRPKLLPGYSLAYPPEMAMTERLAQAGAELVIWPETRYKGYFDNTHVRSAFADRLSGANVALVFQDAETLPRKAQAAGGFDQYNTAVMIGRDGEVSRPYRKIMTMPFGEHVPFAETFPALKNATDGVLAGFTGSLQRGRDHVAFKSGALTLVPLICYETMFPGFVQSAIPSKKPGTVLVGLSSNGWFGDTVQPFQHVNASILRAVENRLPFIHVLNNGPSAVALPNGRILMQTPFREAGGYLVDVPYQEADSLP